MLSGTDQNLLVYSTTSGNIVGQDVRVKEPVWWLKQDRMHGEHFALRCFRLSMKELMMGRRY